jgi:tetratricopeptide (TPR) repeat protein
LFVGRRREANTVEAALREAVSGRTRLILIGGEPGIGKTRLVENVTACAEASGVTVAWGRCHEDDGSPPLWPWVQVVRALQGPDPGGAEAAEASLAELLDVDDQEGRSNAELARFRLYETMRGSLVHASRATPVVIVLDDLQWADPSSLRLLRYLAVELRGARVLLVATFHEPDANADVPLVAALGDLARRPNVERLSLRGLTVAEVAELVRSHTSIDTDAADALAAELHRRTDGNAFFLTELVRLLESEHALQDAHRSTGIPVVVRDVIHRRLARLPDDVQATLRVAAVIGREFSLDVLHRAAGLSADDAFEVLEVAVMAQVVVETDVGRYRFSHGLVREALHAAITPGRRGRLHAKVGLAMEILYGDVLEHHAAQLAHHFGAASAPEQAYGYAELAAEQSERSLAYDDAIAHWEHAIRERDALGGPDVAAARARLLLRLAAAHRGAGDAASSVLVHDLALEAAEGCGDVSLLVEAALAYGEVGLWQVRPYGTVDERVVAAISRLLDESPEDDLLRARLLTGLAVALYYRESERERGRELARQAVTVARRTGNAQLLAASLVELIVMLEAEADQAEQIALAAELEHLLDADLSFDVESTARMRLARLRLSWGDATTLERDIDDVARRADEQRQPIVQLWITWARTAVAFLGGRLAEAERLAGSAFELHHKLGIWGGPETYALHMTLVWREQDRMGEVSPLVEPLLEESQHPGAHKLRALFALERGATDEIESILGPDPLPAARDFTWLSEVCLTAELCAAAGLACSEQLYEVLLPLGGQVATMDGTYLCLGATSHYLGLLAGSLGRRVEAVAHLEEALSLHDRLRAMPWAVRSRFHLALLVDDRSRRSMLLEEATQLAVRHGLVSMQRRLQRVPGE